MKNLKSLARDQRAVFFLTLKAWDRDNGPRLGAALAYYALFSAAPLLLIAVTLAGVVFGDVSAQDEVIKHVHTYVGLQGAQLVLGLMGAATAVKSGFWGALVSIGAMFFAASGMVSELQSGLNDIWKVEPPKLPWLALLRRRAIAICFVLSSGLLLLVALGLNIVISALGKYVSSVLPLTEAALHTMDFGLMFLVTMFLFAMVYKYLPDTRISWRDVWIGAGVTSALLTLGNLVLGIYLGKTDFTTGFGAAGSLILVLVWAYYCAQLVYLGAEFTRLHAQARGLAAGLVRKG